MLKHSPKNLLCFAAAADARRWLGAARELSKEERIRAGTYRKLEKVCGRHTAGEKSKSDARASSARRVFASFAWRCVCCSVVRLELSTLRLRAPARAPRNTRGSVPVGLLQWLPCRIQSGASAQPVSFAKVPIYFTLANPDEEWARPRLCFGSRRRL